jgi:hypothetical protein
MYWVIFVLIGLYFFMPLILASIFNNYQEQKNFFRQREEDRRKEALEAAFAELDSDKSMPFPPSPLSSSLATSDHSWCVLTEGWISLALATRLLQRIEERSKITNLQLNPSRTVAVLRKLDVDGNKQVSQAEFMEMSSVISLNVLSLEKLTPFLFLWWPSLLNNERLLAVRTFVISSTFDRVSQYLPTSFC